MLKKYKTLLSDIFVLIAGSFIFAISVNVFTKPNLIAPGGATGLATVINHFTNIPIGMLILMVNIPLFIIALIKFGWKSMIKTVIATIITSTMVDVTASFMPTYTEDVLLAAIFGGVTCGGGLGIIYMRGMTTGGSDLLGRILELRFPYISYGTLITVVDGLVVVIAALAFGKWSTMLYSWITIFIFGILVDKLLAGLDTAKLVQVISHENEKIANEIIERMNRGATFIKANGAYTGEERDILFIVVKRYELPRLKAIIKATDSSAFIIIGDVTEVLGEGFKPMANKKEKT